MERRLRHPRCSGQSLNEAKMTEALFYLMHYGGRVRIFVQLVCPLLSI